MSDWLGQWQDGLLVWIEEARQMERIRRREPKGVAWEGPGNDASSWNASTKEVRRTHEISCKVSDSPMCVSQSSFYLGSWKLLLSIGRSQVLKVVDDPYKVLGCPESSSGRGMASEVLSKWHTFSNHWERLPDLYLVDCQSQLVHFKITESYRSQWA